MAADQIGLPLPTRPERRLDITLKRIADQYEALTAEERKHAAGEKWLNIVEIVARVRGMEIAEEDVLGRPVAGLADAYDRVVEPGEHAITAVLKTFAEAYCAKETA